MNTSPLPPNNQTSGMFMASSSSNTATTSHPSTMNKETTTKNTASKPSSSCQKCVTVLRELVAGLSSSSSSLTCTNDNSSINESPPLTLIKAIAGGNTEDMKIEAIEDGIKMYLPVQATLPTLLRRYSNWNSHYLSSQQQPQQGTKHGNYNGNDEDDPMTILGLPLATSATKDSPNTNTSEPLAIELKCRKCSSTGPEGGARAFLMGPQPLSVVLCSNRISASQKEVEEILTHELVHLYDVQTLQMDLQQCENLAYSEVRAAKAAECKGAWKQMQGYCVKQKAICATNNLFPMEGRHCINKVFEQAFADNRPFDAPTTTNGARSKQ